MRASYLSVFVVMLVVAVTASAATLTEEEVTTTRDARGVWFIEGGSLYDVSEAMGYAVAQDRLWQMDVFRRQGRGSLSALLGPSMVSTDVFLRTIAYSDEELTQLFAELSPDAQTLIQGYTDGVNRRIGEFYAGAWMQMPYEYWLLSLQSVFRGPGGAVLPQPFTVNDILAWYALMQRNFDPEGSPGRLGQLDNAAMVQALAAAYPTEYLQMFMDLRWINDPAALTYIPAGSKAPQAVDGSMAKRIASLPKIGPALERLRSRADLYNRQMEQLNARVKMGSYAWAIAGDKTESGNPIIYSGPQMGFSTPSIVCEGSIRGGGLEISGMTVAGIPHIIIGRTPHHAWSMQVGHAHTVDYYLEAPQSVSLHRMETIEVFGGDDVTIPIFRSPHGPIIEPMPYNPADPPAVIVAWAYAHWGHEAKSAEAFLKLAGAESIAEFDEGIEGVAVSQHFTYADRDGNIAYWMSGFDPIRAQGVDPRLPSIGDGTTEWTGVRRPRVHDANHPKGWYGGWNNKASIDYLQSFNNPGYMFGPAHRAQVVADYLDSADDLTFEQVRDLAIDIAATDSFGAGGNPWSFVEDRFTAAVEADATAERTAALDLLDGWDGHFVAGGSGEWVDGELRADAWVLQDAWIRELIRLVFSDEFDGAGLDHSDQRYGLLFNVLLHALDGAEASIPTQYDWFQDRSGSQRPTDPDDLIVLALDNVLSDLGPRPWDEDRGDIRYVHDILGELHTTPFGSRSTYAHVVEFSADGPLRIESMFPLGQSGTILSDQFGSPVFDDDFYSMALYFDAFAPRDFPVFDDRR